ncbi:MAG TPA: hypothetical protein ENO20_00910 [Bacteroides sp.]|nr:hypothetical protein [Bacteroides sp.]
MHKENKKSFLEDESLTHHPFRVPEGYFDNFAGRLQQRIREEEEARVPVRRLRSPDRFRIAMAAAVILIALVTYPVIRILNVHDSRVNDYSDLVLLENMDLSDEDLYLLEMMADETSAGNEEDIYLDQAMKHLALHEVELDLISE